MLGSAKKHRESLKRDVHFHLIELVDRIDIALGQTRGLICFRIHKVGSHRTMPKKTECVPQFVRHDVFQNEESYVLIARIDQIKINFDDLRLYRILRANSWNKNRNRNS